uniref:Uncharacterized protein n=1 Tax=Oryzias latipes TaxID=8090 RepID=A0A3B3HZM8_ORYLA
MVPSQHHKHKTKASNTANQEENNTTEDLNLFQVTRSFQAVSVYFFSRTLASAGKELKDNFLEALAERMLPHRSGKMTGSSLLQPSNCYVMGFPSNIFAIPLGWEQNPYCVKLSGKQETLPGRTDSSHLCCSLFSCCSVPKVTESLDPEGCSLLLFLSSFFVAFLMRLSFTLDPQTLECFLFVKLKL